MAEFRVRAGARVTPAAPAEPAGLGWSRHGDDFLYHVLQAQALEAAVEDLLKDGALESVPAAGFRVDPRCVAVACAMRRQPEGGDVCCPGPTSLGPALAFGATPLEFLRWAAAKGTAAAAARAGGWSWTDLRRGLLGFDGPPGAMTQVMAGVALAFRRRGESRAALVFEDDLALETGRWHEGMSLATALAVPLIVVLAPAGARAARSDSEKERDAPVSAADAAANYGLESVSLAGRPLDRVHELAAHARQRAADGGGPTLLEMGLPAAEELEDWRQGRAAAPADGEDAGVRRARRAALAAVEHATARLRLEPDPAGAEAMAPVLSGSAQTPHWTRLDPPDPGERPPARPDLAGVA